MSELASQIKQPRVRHDKQQRIERGLKRRYRAERRFKLYGLISIILGLGFLIFLLISIVQTAYPAFFQTAIRLDIHFDPQVITPTGVRDPQTLRDANYRKLITEALAQAFPEASSRTARRDLRELLSTGAIYQLRDQVLEDPALIDTTQSLWLMADDNIDALVKGTTDRTLPEAQRRVTDQQLAWLDQLAAQDRLERRFNWTLFTMGDSRDPELAGIRGALMGSLFTLSVTLMLSFPIGVATAVYLEEFAPRNRLTDLIEVNINNLAAVPSIIFGLLGLAVFINFFGLPRSTPLVGGLVLALMTLPIIIIASRAALRAVPPSVREAALGVGASRMQVVTDHVLPLALPGMLTGAIIGMSHALGETAPLLLIGMVAFIVDVPNGWFDPATVLPVQIYLWSDAPERAFVQLTSAAILVLLAFLIIMNAAAIILRKRFERRW